MCSKVECDGSDGGVFPILVCRVALGKPCLVNRRMLGEAFAHDSVIAYDKFKKHEKSMDIFYSEFVVSDNTRIYPQVCFSLWF